MLIVAFCPPLLGQSISAGMVRGTVSDSAGRPMADVRVAVIDTRSGSTRDVRTPRRGAFQFGFLPPGVYDLLAERLGYLPVEVRGIRVSPGGDVDVNVVLAAVEPPVLERDVTLFGDRLDRTSAGTGWRLGDPELRMLPDRRRDIASAARFSTIADDALTIEGLPATYSQLSVDGFPFQLVQHPVLVRGRPTDFAFPLSAFSEVTLDRGGPDVEWNDAASGRLSAVGPRGSNTFRTRLYADWAPTALTGSQYFHPSRAGGQSYRGGVVFSGPIIRDTSHFVFGLDAQRLTVPMPPAWEPSATDGALTNAADGLGVDLKPYEEAYRATMRLASGFGRVEWQANQRNRLSFLALGSRVDADNPPLGPDRAVGLGATLKGWDLGLGAGLTNILSNSLALEMRLGFQVGQEEYAGTGGALTVMTDGPATWGTDRSLPGRFRRSAFRATETAHVTLGSHHVKLGGGGSFVSHNDIYADNRRGVFTFGGVDGLQNGDGAFVQTVGSEPIASFKTYELGWFLQDTWVPAPGAELTVGMRMDWEHVARTALIRNVQLAALSGIVNDSITALARKFSPRAGFRWDVGNTHQWVVGAYAGVYYGSVAEDALREAVAETGNRQLRYGTGMLGAWPAPPDSITAPLSGALVSVLPSGFGAPRSTKAGLSVAGVLGDGLIIHLSGSYRHTQFLVRRRDINAPLGAVGRDQYGRPLYANLEQYGSTVVAAPGAGRRLDGFAMVSALNQDGVSDYAGATLRLERHLGDHLALSLGYTYSVTTDNVLGMAGSLDQQLSPFPDSLNGVDWADGVSDFDVPHRVAVGLELGFSAFRLASFFGFQSGRPFTPGFRDGVDANGDGSGRNDPAYIDNQIAGVSDLFGNWNCLRTQVGRFAERNSCRGPTQRTLDVRLVLGPFHLGYPVELVVDGMNLLDTELADVDRAVYLVDPAGTLTSDPSTGVVTVPLLANPNFGKPVHRLGSGRYLRFGLRVNL